MAQRKHGIVYIADWPEGWRQPSESRYYGHWESPEAAKGILEQGPGWDDPEQAIRWGRERAPMVFIRVGAETYSAGEVDPEDEVVLRWESRPG